MSLTLLSPLITSNFQFHFFLFGFSKACPNGMTNITGQTSGEILYPSSGNYGVNKTKCWRIEVPRPYRGIGIYRHA